jgi:osmotically inducible lipoprotein OsmB
LVSKIFTLFLNEYLFNLLGKFMSLSSKYIAGALILILLSACGHTPGQRALSGGAIGAGVGTAGALLLNANPVTGALIGAGAGAVTGAVTKKKNLNLGEIN